jgi:hypothetical protein
MEVDLYKLALESDLFETLDSPKAQRLRLVTLFLALSAVARMARFVLPRSLSICMNVLKMQMPIRFFSLGHWYHLY